MVGVKILHPKLANRKDLVSRFRREARAMSQLTHPNTVKVFMFGELDDGSLYIIMEFLEGKNLNQTRARRGAVPDGARAARPHRGVRRARRGAQGRHHPPRPQAREHLPRASRRCMRDYPKVLDFGLAKVGERQMRPGSVILTQEGMVFGTPEFMSPEQAQGKALTPASDMYSLAVILYEVLTGKLPFDAKSAMDYIQLHVTGKPIPLSAARPGPHVPAAARPASWTARSPSAPRIATRAAADFASAMQYVLQGATYLPPHLAGPTSAEMPTTPFAHAPVGVPVQGMPAQQQPMQGMPQQQRPAAGNPAQGGQLSPGNRGGMQQSSPHPPVAPAALERRPARRRRAGFLSRRRHRRRADEVRPAVANARRRGATSESERQEGEKGREESEEGWWGFRDSTPNPSSDLPDFLPFLSLALREPCWNQSPAASGSSGEKRIG